MLLLLSLTAAALAFEAVDESFVSYINSIPGLKWKAGLSGPFAGKKFSELPHGGPPKPEHPTRPLRISRDDLPDSFSWLEERPECMGEVLDQSICGNCWAFSVIEAFSDKRCIFQNDTERVLYSVQYLTQCDNGPQMNGCNGGNILFAGTFLTTVGVTTDECVPYNALTAGQAVCPEECADGSLMPYLIRAKGWKNVGNGGSGDVTGLMESLILKGPLSVCFNDYPSLAVYTGGIYSPAPTEKPTGTHCCEIVGYGHEMKDGEDTPYWTVRNSWGATWGENGYFRILRGQNTCSIEEDALELRV